MTSIFLAVLSSFLLILSFPKFNLSFFAWVGFVPLFIACGGKTRRQCFFLFYLSGLIFWAGILYWLVQVNLIGFLLLIFYLALYFGIFGLLIGYTLPRTASLRGRHATHYTPKIATQKLAYRKLPTAYSLLPSVSYLLFLPCLWVSLEFIRSHLFTGFGWALLGYSQYTNLPIIQIADVTGGYGVSFLIILVNATIEQVLLEVKKQKSENRNYLFPFFYLLTVLCLLSSAFIYGYSKLTHFPLPTSHFLLRISLIQGNIPQHQKWDAQLKESILSKYIHLSEQTAKSDSPHLIIWPETAVPAYFNQDKELKKRILSLSSEINTPLLIGTATFQKNKPGTRAMQGKSFNSAILISSGKAVQQYDKLHLVPFGEYAPSLFSFVRNFIEIGDFSKGREWKIFSLPSNLYPLSSFAVLICFEDVFPYLSRGFVKRGADFLINISNDAWFGKTSAPYQHCQSAVFRAVENRVNVIKCSNTGVSCFISPAGRISGRLSKQGKDIFVAGYSTQKILIEKTPLTFYTRFGDVFAILCLLFCAGFGIIKRHEFSRI
ncbi:MAG: apolipoprotein N-acyltransferase [Candidatus Omnitrophica bacterium 4484_213]|nr:MAG: apolipoprotein N-acyltransferase [Candidatus Omnitrophica bacterium 4484_213]